MNLLYPAQQDIPERGREGGNVLFYILIAIVLLAALSMAVARSGRESISTVNREKSDLGATEIMGYANALRNGVQNMLVQGVKENQICFKPNADITTFDYAACGDTKNMVFNAQGGGVSPQIHVSDTLLDAAAIAGSGSAFAGVWYYTGTIRAEKVGSDCASADCNEISAVLFGVSKDICTALNTKLGIDNPTIIPANLSTITPTPYLGVMDYDANAIINITALDGRRTGCFRDAGGLNVFYAVLIAH